MDTHTHAVTVVHTDIKDNVPVYMTYVEDIICTSYNYGIMLAELCQYDLAER